MPTVLAAPSATVLVAASPSTGTVGATSVTPMVKVCEEVSDAVAGSRGHAIGVAGGGLVIDLGGIGDRHHAGGGIDVEAAAGGVAVSEYVTALPPLLVAETLRWTDVLAAAPSTMLLAAASISDGVDSEGATGGYGVDAGRPI